MLRPKGRVILCIDRAQDGTVQGLPAVFQRRAGRRSSVRPLAAMRHAFGQVARAGIRQPPHRPRLGVNPRAVVEKRAQGIAAERAARGHLRDAHEQHGLYIVGECTLKPRQFRSGVAAAVVDRGGEGGCTAGTSRITASFPSGLSVIYRQRRSRSRKNPAPARLARPRTTCAGGPLFLKMEMAIAGREILTRRQDPIVGANPIRARAETTVDG